MRYTLTLLLFFTGAIVFAQDNVLLKVIAYSDGVTIDREPVTVGMYVSNPDHMVTIPAGGYMGLITNKGEVFRLTSSMRVGAVAPYLRKELLMSTGRVTHCLSGVTVYPVQYDLEQPIVGDSLILSWIPDSPQMALVGDATVAVLDKFQDPISQWTSNRSYSVIGINKDSPMIGVKGKYEQPSKKNKKTQSSYSYSFALKHPDEEQFKRLNFDLARLDGVSDRLLVESAVYLLHKLVLDSTWDLYKVMKSKTSTTDPVLSAYYKNSLEKYRFDKIAID